MPQTILKIVDERTRNLARNCHKLRCFESQCLYLDINDKDNFHIKSYEIRLIFILLVPSNRKSHTGFRFGYLHLILAHSKDQDQGESPEYF